MAGSTAGAIWVVAETNADGSLAKSSTEVATLARTLAATTIPTAARLGVSVQPEALTTGLVVLGAAATCMDGSRRLGGALALALACLCRYDAWPAAATFGALCAVDAIRVRDGERRTLGAQQ